MYRYNTIHIFVSYYFLCVIFYENKCYKEEGRNGRVEMGWNEKRIENILSNKESAERVYYILEKQGYKIESGFPGFIQSVEKESLMEPSLLSLI